MKQFTVCIPGKILYNGTDLSEFTWPTEAHDVYTVLVKELNPWAEWTLGLSGEEAKTLLTLINLGFSSITITQKRALFIRLLGETTGRPVCEALVSKLVDQLS